MKTVAHLLVHLAGLRRRRARFYIKTDKMPRAGSTVLAGRILPAGQTLPISDLQTADKHYHVPLNI